MEKRKLYEKLEMIGRGSFGEVFKVRHRKTKEILVLKEVNLAMMSPRKKDEAVNEVRILMRLEHRNLLHFREAFLCEAKLHIVTEYCEEGDLAGYIRRQLSLIREPLIWKVLAQVSLGLAHIHSEGILHRDMKAANIFLKRKFEIRIGDFGIAKDLGENQMFTRTLVGTPCYLSPELLTGIAYGEQNDVWGLGCIIYEMCKQSRPFKAQREVELQRQIIKTKQREIPKKYSPDLQRLVEKLLNKDPFKRPSVADILEMPKVKTAIEELGNDFKKEQSRYVSLLKEMSKNRPPMPRLPVPKKKKNPKSEIAKNRVKHRKGWDNGLAKEKDSKKKNIRRGKKRVKSLNKPKKKTFFQRRKELMAQRKEGRGKSRMDREEEKRKMWELMVNGKRPMIGGAQPQIRLRQGGHNNFDKHKVREKVYTDFNEEYVWKNKAEDSKDETSESRQEWKKDMMMYNAFADSDEDSDPEITPKKDVRVFQKKKKGKGKNGGRKNKERSKYKKVGKVFDSDSDGDFDLVKYKSGILGGRKGFAPELVEDEEEEEEGLIIYNAFAEETPGWKSKVGEPGYKGPHHKDRIKQKETKEEFQEFLSNFEKELDQMSRLKDRIRKMRQNKTAKDENDRWKSKGVDLAQIQIQGLNSLQNLKPSKPKLKSDFLLRSPRDFRKKKPKNRSSLDKKAKEREQRAGVNINSYLTPSGKSFDEIPYKDCSAKSRDKQKEKQKSGEIKEDIAEIKSHVKNFAARKRADSKQSYGQYKNRKTGKLFENNYNFEDFEEEFSKLSDEEEKPGRKPRGPVNPLKAKKMRDSRIAKRKKKKELQNLNKNMRSKNPRLYGSGPLVDFKKRENLYASNYAKKSRQENKKKGLQGLKSGEIKGARNEKRKDTFKRRHTVAEMGKSEKILERPEAKKYSKQKSVAYARKKKYGLASKSKYGRGVKQSKQTPTKSRALKGKRNKSSKKKKRSSHLIKKPKLSKSSCFGFGNDDPEMVDPEPFLEIYHPYKPKSPKSPRKKKKKERSYKKMKTQVETHSRKKKSALKPKKKVKSVLLGLDSDLGNLDRINSKYNFLEQKMRDRSRQNRQEMMRDWREDKKQKLGRQKDLKSFLENDFLRDASEAKEDLPEERPNWFQNAIRDKLRNL